MDLSTPQPRNPSLPIFFNVSTSVGNQGMNTNRDDILLVQFFLRKNGEKVPAKTAEGAAENEIMKRVPLSGVADPATIAGIRAFQTAMRRKIPSTAIDGRVSPARNYSYGSGMFTIAAMNGFLRRHCKDVWPRIHDFTDCPEPVRAKARELI